MKKRILLMAAISSLVIAPLMSCKPVISYRSQTGNNLYRVDFNSNGGTYVSSLTTTIIENSPVSTRNGYTLNGWYIDNESSLVAFPYTVSGDLTLNASWSKNKYDVTFVTDGGSPVESLHQVEVIENSPITTKEGYSFEGWHLLSDLSDDIISFPYTVNENTTLYAEWIRNEIEPAGQYLAYAKVDNIKAKSYWSFEYLEDSIKIHVNVVDECVYTYNTNLGYNDNVEIIISPKVRNIISGMYTSNSSHFLVDASGQGYYNVPINPYTLSENMPVPSSCNLRAGRASLLANGFNGYICEFDISYQLLGLTRETALDNLTCAIGMRNSNSYTATKWDSSTQANYMNNWSYYLLKSNGEFAISEVKPATLIINETVFYSGNWTTINEDLSSYDVRAYNNEMKLKEWAEKAPEIAQLKAEKVIIGIGRYTYHEGKMKNSEMVEKIGEVISAFLEEYEKENIYVTSIDPLKNYATRISDLKALNTSLQDKCNELQVNYIDTLSAFLKTDGSLDKTLFKNNFVFNASGYSKYLDVIKNYL